MNNKLTRTCLIAWLLAVLVASSIAAPAPAMIHIRGSVKSLSQDKLTLSTAGGTETVALKPQIQVVDIVPASRSLITSGRFVGITSVVGSDGVQRAVEVHVFPESMRGAGEGTRPWDFPGAPSSASKMTNGTVGMRKASRMTNGTISGKSAGSSIIVTYSSASGSGSQTITIPPGIPVVTFTPGGASDLKPGASVFVMAVRSASGGMIAERIMVGKGVKPPM
jgi:hypothetical protein